MIYYVSTSGLDANPGTQSSPFNTIQHAATLAVAGDTVTIFGGVYRETVTPKSNGVTFAPFSGDVVIVNGADIITKWTSAGNGIFTAPLSWSLGDGQNQLFDNGRMINEARWPKLGPDISNPIKSQFTTVSNITATTATITDKSITQQNGYWNGAYIHIMAGEAWICTYGKVLSHVGQTLTISYTCSDVGAFGQKWEWIRAGNKYYLFGVKNAFTQTDECFFDGALVHYAPVNITASTILGPIEIKHREWAFNLSGLSNTTISNISLFACAILTDANSSNNVIDGINAKYTSHFSLCTGWSAPANTGITIHGTNNTVKNSTIRYSAGDGIWADGKNHVILNNTISDVNYCGTDATGVWAPWGSGHVITQNTINNSGREGIRIEATPITITNNEVSNCMLQTTDGGGIYTYGANGRGSQIAYNITHSIHGGGFGGAGVYLDNGCSNFNVHHNLSYDVDCALKNNHPSTDNTIANNTFIGTQYAVAADAQTGFTGSVYSNNIMLGGPVQIGPEAKLVNNFISGNPQFISPSTGNYQITAGSPAIAMGAYVNGLWQAGAVRKSTQTYIAMDYDVMNKIAPTSPAGSLDQPSVGFASAGSWICFKQIDFTNNPTTFYANVAVRNQYTSLAHPIEIHIDSPTGPKVGALPIAGTGPNFADWFSYTTQSTSVSGLSGVHDLYLVWTGGGNLLTFRFA